MSTIKTVSFCDELSVFEYEQVDLPPSPEPTILFTPGSIPPPPSTTLPSTIFLTSLTTSNDLENIMKKLKKPTQQHIVNFKERYEMALKRDEEKLNESKLNK